MARTSGRPSSSRSCRPWATCCRLHGARTSSSTRAKARPGRPVVISGGSVAVRLRHHRVTGYMVTRKAKSASSVPPRASAKAKPSWRRWASNRSANKSAWSSPHSYGGSAYTSVYRRAAHRGRPRPAPPSSVRKVTGAAGVTGPGSGRPGLADIVACLLAEAGDLEYVRVPADQVAAERGQPVDDQRGAGIGREPGGVHSDGSELGGLALGPPSRQGERARSSGWWAIAAVRRGL